MLAQQPGREQQDPDGGRIVRDANGNPAGTFIDAAMDLIEAHMPAPSAEQRKARVLAAAKAIAANGLTEMHDAGIDAATITAVKELIDEKRFPIRVYAMLGDNAELLRTWFASTCIACNTQSSGASSSGTRSNFVSSTPTGVNHRILTTAATAPLSSAVCT